MIKWDDEGEDTLFLLTPAEFELLPDGIKLESISGNKKIKGKDYINDDTRFGHMAYGVRNISTHKDKDLLLLFLLKR